MAAGERGVAAHSVLARWRFSSCHTCGVQQEHTQTCFWRAAFQTEQEEFSLFFWYALFSGRRQEESAAHCARDKRGGGPRATQTGSHPLLNTHARA